MHPSYLDAFVYPEEVLEVRIESLKDQIESLLIKFKRILKQIKRSHHSQPKSTVSISNLEILLNVFASTKRKHKPKSIGVKNVGTIMVQSVFINVGRYQVI